VVINELLGNGGRKSKLATTYVVAILPAVELWGEITLNLVFFMVVTVASIRQRSQISSSILSKRSRRDGSEKKRPWGGATE
jgi:hypothetical protein